MIDSFLSDLQLLIEDCEMNDKQIGEMVNAADELGVSINYFIEEFFVFEKPRVHDVD